MEKGLISVYSNTNNILKNLGYNKPIGIALKNKEYLTAILSYNIGNGIFSNDGFSTTIGSLADPYQYENSNAWFYKDVYKNKTSDYIEYINQMYYNDNIVSGNFMPQEAKMNLLTLSDLSLHNASVGVIRHYIIQPINLAKNTSGTNSINPNLSLHDTRLGYVNNFYLNATLLNASGYIGYTKSITKNFYENFGLLGKYGISSTYDFFRNSRILTNKELVGNIAPWNYEDTSFGDFYSMQNIQSLLAHTNDATKSYILKSLYGFDLLSNNMIEENGDQDYTPLTKKKYYPSNGLRNKNYIDLITNSEIKFATDDENKIYRIELINPGNSNLNSSHILYAYAESEYNTYEKNNKKYSNLNTNVRSQFNGGIINANGGVNYGKYVAYGNSNLNKNKNDIINYTNDKFIQGKIDTLIGRFHTTEYASIADARNNKDITSTAISKYGMSHGRNLLKKNHVGSKTNGYSDPYCRVWTFHHQYAKLDNLIRPFQKEDRDKLTYNKTTRGLNNLSNYSVRGANNLIQYAPTEYNNIKRCMFSIENLAWKGEKDAFSKRSYEKGPLGGRIMWFPPYGLQFSDSSSVNWNENQFIGRGEKIYTYTNTERTGTLSFILLMDHPSIINKWSKNIKGSDSIGDVDDVDSAEQQILRFFAGCDILDGTFTDEKKTNTVSKKEDPIIPQTNYEEINFYVFFPNDYSGVDDINNGIQPMDYLINGVGCNIYKDTNNQEKIISPNLNNIFLKNNCEGTQIGGYELRSSIGISIDDSYTNNIDMGSICCNDTIYNLIKYKATDKNGKIKYWSYRVDKRVDNEVLAESNYIDSNSYALNGQGFTALTEVHTDAKALLTEKNNLYSFVDVYCALNPKATDILDESLYNQENVNILKDIFNKRSITTVELTGFASAHGYNQSNLTLSHNRANTVYKWLQSCSNKFKAGNYKILDSTIEDEINNQDVNSFEAKVWRCTKVSIKLQKEEINNVVNDSKDNNKKNSNVTNVQELSALSQINNENVISGDTTVNETIENEENAEYTYFKMLEENEPFLQSKIVEKVKYFNPAFHSITPEGFNARLNFLQQCTRQGSTSSNSDINNVNRTANNLAFGRPPICVLRIGDFYNTKIIIRNIDINFNNSTWDLNDEGIGVMPNYAEITISFVFIGGSDLTGPIQRLQNALSFNYYANTSVYDDSAESVINEDNFIQIIK